MPTPLEPIVRDYRRSTFPCSMRDSEHHIQHDCLEYIGCKDDYYKCSQHGCDQDFMCIGCAYECDGCGDDFCREHIIDVARDGQVLKRLCAYCYQKQPAAVALQRRVSVGERVAA